MSWLSGSKPKMNLDSTSEVEMVIIPRTSDIGNYKVRRVLPFRNKRMVGPFIFWDQMGPGEFLTGQGLDVRPHPHIGLSTVTYLLEGTLDHRDSLGNNPRIKPGDVNLMTAGSGVVHSERTGQDKRKTNSKLFGIQSWLAQPKEHENGIPEFSHTDINSLPIVNFGESSGRIILGEYEGVKSPIATQWPTIYVEFLLKINQKVKIPNFFEERAIYVLDGEIEIAGVKYPPLQMYVLQSGSEVIIRSLGTVRLMLLGGAVMDGPRYIFWNFVSSDKNRLEQAKTDWKNGNFPVVPGDEKEFAPLPK